MNVNLLLAHTSSLSVLVPLFIAFLQWRQLSFQLKIIAWALIFAALTDGICFMFFYFSLSKNSFLLINILCLIQFTLFVYAFSLLHNRRLFFVIVYVAFVTFYGFDFFWIEGPYIFNTFSNAVSSLILIVFSIHYLYSLLSELREVYIYRLPMLWIVFGILAYCSGTLFLFLATNYLITSWLKVYGNMWVLNYFLNVTLNMLFAIGLWQNYRTVRADNG